MDDDLIDPDLPPPQPLWRRVLMGWILPAVGFVVLWFAVGWLRAPVLPPAAPGFSLVTATGEPIDLTDFRGQTVVLNFWATWCGPCRLEGPSFASFAESNPDIVVLGMTEDDNSALVRRTGASLGLTYPLVMSDAATNRAYGITTYPTTVVIGPDGDVRHAHTGLLFGPQLWALTKL